jgi:class 3 adenylate cyclase
VRCAVLLADTIARLLPPDIGTAGVQARVGIHSGLALAGTVGGGTRLKYTVVGDVVNVAARLQALDLPDPSGARCPIIVSSDTLALLDAPPAQAEDLGLLTLSGRAHPVHAWRLAGAPRHHP